MGKRGPAPKPTVLKRRAGNPGKRPLNTREPQPDPTRPYCPAHLSLAAKRHWRRLAPLLAEARLLTSVDRDVLAVYCEVYARWRRVEELLRAQGDGGLTYTTESGYVQMSALLTISNRCIAQMKPLIRELGLSPSARSSITVPAEEAEASFTDSLEAELEAWVASSSSGAQGERPALPEVA